MVGVTGCGDSLGTRWTTPPLQGYMNSWNTADWPGPQGSVQLWGCRKGCQGGEVRSGMGSEAIKEVVCGCWEVSAPRMEMGTDCEDDLAG